LRDHGSSTAGQFDLLVGDHSPRRLNAGDLAAGGEVCPVKLSEEIAAILGYVRRHRELPGG
jgi:hypothetical protein